MSGPHPAVAATRVAVRRVLQHREEKRAGVLVGCSGGADSLALAAATAFETRDGPIASAVVVDHGLQAGSSAVARRAAEQCRSLGLDPVEVVAVDVERSGRGVEAAARSARLTALEAAAGRHGAHRVLLGHTLDDQAEQVLLGLARGSGTRSLAGMPPARPFRADAAVRLARPFLELSRQVTAQACTALGLHPWQDPQNQDTDFTRVRARATLATMEEALGPGIAQALARTANLLRDDAEALDAAAAAAYRDLGPPPWKVADLTPLPVSVRRRVWLLLAGWLGAPSGSVTSTHLYAVDKLLTDWHGQGAVDLPGAHRIGRTGDRVWPARHRQS